MDRRIVSGRRSLNRANARGARYWEHRSGGGGQHRRTDDSAACNNIPAACTSDPTTRQERFAVRTL